MGDTMGRLLRCGVMVLLALMSARATAQDIPAASGRALASAQAEIVALKSAMEKLNSELAQMKSKVEPTSEK